MKKKKIKRVFNIIFGTSLKPRLSVFRSNKHIYCQLIDDENRVTICSSSTLDSEYKKSLISTSNKESSFIIGKNIAEKALRKKISFAIFDRGFLPYHGRIKSLAEGAREGGLIF